MTALERVRLQPGRRYGLNLDDPCSALGLFRAEEMLTLGRFGWWPLPRSAKRYLTTSAAAEEAARPKPDDTLSALLDLAEARPAALKKLLWAVLRRRGAR